MNYCFVLVIQNRLVLCFLRWRKSRADQSFVCSTKNVNKIFKHSGIKMATKMVTSYTGSCEWTCRNNP